MVMNEGNVELYALESLNSNIELYNIRLEREKMIIECDVQKYFKNFEHCRNTLQERLHNAQNQLDAAERSFHKDEDRIEKLREKRDSYRQKCYQI